MVGLEIESFKSFKSFNRFDNCVFLFEQNQNVCVCCVLPSTRSLNKISLGKEVLNPN